MNFAALVQAVLDRYSEATNQRFVDEDDAKLAIQEAYDWISDATEWNEVRVPILTRAGRCYYDLRAYVGDDAFLYARAFYHPGSGRWLDLETVRHLDLNVYPFWEEVPGNPWRVVFPAYGWVGFQPQPATDDDLVSMVAVTLPSQLEADTDVPLFPSQFHLGLVEYALSDLFSQDGEDELALEHWGKYPQSGEPGTGYLRIEHDLTQYVNARATADRHTIIGMGYLRGRSGSVR